MQGTLKKRRYEAGQAGAAGEGRHKMITRFLAWWEHRFSPDWRFRQVDAKLEDAERSLKYARVLLRQYGEELAVMSHGRYGGGKPKDLDT